MQAENKVVWVTGASAGIGEAIALEFASRGAKVVLSARRKEQLEAVAKKASEAGASGTLILPLDLNELDSFQPAMDQILEKWGQIDVLVNNAGISQRALVKDTEVAVDERLMKINYLGTVGLTKVVLPHLLAQKSGAIGVVSSLVGKFGTPYRSSYAASKHALHGFFDSLRTEVYDKGLTITILCPGFIRTDISKNALTGDGSKLNEMDDAQANGMPPSVLAVKAVKAILKGKREIAIGGGERFGILVNRLFPGLFAKIIRKTKVR